MNLIKFLNIARGRKMTMFTDTHIQLTKVHADHVASVKGAPLEIRQEDLLAIIKTPDSAMVLGAFELIESSALSEPVHSFEYTFAYTFIKNCVITTFPDYRQKFMRSLGNFLVRLRTVFYKDIKKGLPVQVLVTFLGQVIDYCQHNLYLDKPIEGSFPMFDILKSIQELFGGIEHHLNKGKVFEPLNLLQKTGLLESRSLFNFLVNSLKSSWANVRRNSFELLTRYADTYSAFHDSKFVNELLIPTALDYANDPRAMMAEAAALMLKLAFLKCTDVIVLDRKPLTGTRYERRLALLRYVLKIVMERLQTFKTTLISKGQTTALIHGYIAFFKHIFADFSLEPKVLSAEEFEDWRTFFIELLKATLEISKVCSGLLSNNRLTEEGSELVDSRGHPIVQEQDLKNIDASGE